MGDVKLFRNAVQSVGHHDTGDLELAITSLADPEKAKPFIRRSFEEN
jgi:predicted transport protein